MLSHWCLPSASPAEDRQNEHFGYRQETGSPTAAPPFGRPQAAAFKAFNRLSQSAIWFQLAKFRLPSR